MAIRGNLSEASLPDVLQLLAMGSKTGTLSLVSFATNLVLVPVVFFYFLRDWDVMMARLDELIPRRWHAQVSSMAQEIDTVLSEFLRGQLSVMLIMALFYSIGLWLVGLDYALPIGILSGLLVFVPYLGAISGMLLATLAGLVQYGSVSGLLPIWGVFALGANYRRLHRGATAGR